MTKNTERLPAQSSQLVNQEGALTFSFEGRPVPALSGDTVASALAAHGRRIFSRSFKYHRPRGLLCCSGDCPNCIMEIDGKPNVRACREQVKQGMRVRSQHACIVGSRCLQNYRTLRALAPDRFLLQDSVQASPALENSGADHPQARWLGPCPY